MHRFRRLVAVLALLTLAACTADSGVTAGEAAPRSSPIPAESNGSGDASATSATAPAPAGTDQAGSAPASTGAVVDSVPDLPVAKLDWHSCDDPAISTGLECGTISVPLDYARPDGDHLDVAVARLPAAKQSKRVGAILLNPGGPGGSGIEFASNLSAAATDIFGKALTDTFDLVGFDPRGVDRSGGIHCVTDSWLDAHLYLDDTPDTPAEQAALDASDQEFNAGCRKALGDTITDYSTVATARDMDQIRAAVGDDQLTFYGASYGTFLGATYATLFPDRVRAMVLDSAYSPVGDDPLEGIKTDIIGFEGAFADWATWCDGEATCAFHDTSTATIARWEALLTKLDDSPLTSGDRPVNQSVMRLATIEALYSRSDWPVLAIALAGGETGDGSGLLSLADRYNQRDASGHYSTLSQANPVIRCASGIGSPAVPDPTAAVAEIKRIGPHFGATVTESDLKDSCTDLTGPVTPLPLSYAAKGPILVVGGTHDPATPFRWAEKMAGELHAVLLRYEGEGHASLTDASCVAEAGTAVLVDLKLPVAGTSCQPDAPTTAPSWWSSQPAVPGTSTVPVDDVGSLLGLPKGTYGEILSTDGDATTTIDRATTAFENGGWTSLNAAKVDIGTDARRITFVDADNHAVQFVVIGVKSFDSPDAAPLKALVPAGDGIIIRFPAQ